MIPLAEPLLDGNELEYVSDCIKTGWVSSQGTYVSRFEEKFSEFLDCNAVAVSSGTAALHLALKALDIGPGDEVIVPDLTFAAVANAVIHCGAKPVLADVERRTWNIDPRSVESLVTKRTKAIIVVHSWGHPCDMTWINAVAARYKLKVIEDCAEAQGATYEGHLVGKLGDVGCFSFFPNKIMTTGEGGMVTARDGRITKKVKILRDHGMTATYWHDVAGFNYRMTNMQAAVGLAQMERIQALIDRRREIGRHYIARLKYCPKLKMPPSFSWSNTVFWLFSVLVLSNEVSRDELIAMLADKQIETRPFFYPLHEQPPYKLDNSYPVSTELSKQGISLPSGNAITKNEIDAVCDVILGILR